MFSLQATQNEKLWAFAKYLYDAPQQRTRFFEMGKYNNQSFTIDVLLLYREVRGPGQLHQKQWNIVESDNTNSGYS